jgi:hypothetical protein
MKGMLCQKLRGSPPSFGVAADVGPWSTLPTIARQRHGALGVGGSLQRGATEDEAHPRGDELAMPPHDVRGHHLRTTARLGASAASQRSPQERAGEPARMDAVAQQDLSIDDGGVDADGRLCEPGGTGRQVGAGMG